MVTAIQPVKANEIAVTEHHRARRETIEVRDAESRLKAHTELGLPVTIASL
jgi:hypothetical protein